MKYFMKYETRKTYNRSYMRHRKVRIGIGDSQMVIRFKRNTFNISTENNSYYESKILIC